MTCAHNVMTEIKSGEFKKCDELGLYLGKKGGQKIENPDTISLYITLDANDILVPSNYKGK
jgi:hypothetical protein